MERVVFVCQCERAEWLCSRVAHGRRRGGAVWLVLSFLLKQWQYGMTTTTTTTTIAEHRRRLRWRLTLCSCGHML